MQSSRKAVIQTLFKELRELPLDFKLATPKPTPVKLKNAEAIHKAENVQGVQLGAEFTRGELIEVDVTLAVDPVFKLGAMMTEWSAMADEFPGMFGSGGALGFLRDSEPIMRVLDRFLAGLIPIKAVATHYLVVVVDECEYVVHKATVEGLGLETRPLLITGVTEHIGYWRDIRRVLFSGARFTILGRVGRDGIQASWTPVKLADLFSEVAPDFVNTINAIRSPSASGLATGAQTAQQVAFDTALEIYRLAITPAGMDWSDEDQIGLETLKSEYNGGSTDASIQRRAFDAVRSVVIGRYEIESIEPNLDLKARQDARTGAGLELFPSRPAEMHDQASESASERIEERLLDIEVIAIYW